MSPELIKRIITETFARYETHFREPEKILEFVHDDIDWWFAGSTPLSGHKNREAKLAMLAPLSHLSDSGIRLRATSFVIEGDHAAVEGDSFMTLKDGREYHNQYAWFFEFKDGKIFRAREYFDTAHTLEVLVG